VDNQAKTQIIRQAYEDAVRQSSWPGYSHSSRGQYINNPEQLRIYEEAFREAQQIGNQAYQDAANQAGGMGLSTNRYRYINNPVQQGLYDQAFREAQQIRGQAYQDAARAAGTGSFFINPYQYKNPAQRSLYDQALREAQQIRDQAYQDAAQTLFRIGFIPTNRHRLNNPEQQRIYDEAFRMAEQNAPNIMSQAIRDAQQQALGPVGASYFSFGRGRYTYAEQQIYDEAFHIAQENIRLQKGIWPAKESTFNDTADLLADSRPSDKVLAVLGQRLVTMAEKNDLRKQGIIHNNIGYVCHAQGRPSDAEAEYQKALNLLPERGKERAITLNNIGLVYLALAQRHADETLEKQKCYDKALESQEQALAIWQDLKDQAGKDKARIESQTGEATTFNSIGLVYRAQERYDEALNSYQQALAIWQQLEDKTWEVIILNNIGRVYEAQRGYVKALESYQQALDIVQEMDGGAGRESSRNNIWTEAEVRKRYEEALESLQQLLDDQKNLQRLPGYRKKDAEIAQSITLRAIGLVYQALGRDDEASKSLRQAREIQRRYKDRSELEITLDYLGLVFQAQGRSDEAREAYQEAQAIRGHIISKNIERDTDQPYDGQGHHAEALDAYEQPQIIQPDDGSQVEAGVILYNIGRVYAAQGDYAKALDAYQQAMDYFDESRARIWSEQGRAAFIAQHASLYAYAVGLFHQQGEDEEAFFTSERGRARTFLDSLATGQIELADDLAVALLAREQEVYAERQAAQQALDNALASNSQDMVEAAEFGLTFTEANYNIVLAAIEARDDRLAMLVPNRQTVLGVSEVQALLDEQTTLLSYFVLDDQTLAFLITSQSFEVVEIQASHQELVEKAKGLRVSIDKPEAAQQWSQQLYRSLIAPISDSIHTPHLTIVPHGPLHYLPFAALQSADTGQYLIERYTLVALPSASSLSFIQKNIGGVSGSPLILGNPVTDDPPLFFAEDEARAIADLYSVQPLLNGAATEGIVRAKAAKTSILHLAAHANYIEDNPLSSAVSLSPDEPYWFRSAFSALFLTPDVTHDGRLEVREVYGLDLAHTDLVVLSGCQTQLGKLSAGDEVVGLTRAFFFAGTPTVVAILWSVDDEATGLLMERFYTHLQERMGKAAALRQAQLDMLDDYPNNPYYWSGFVLSGDGGTMQVPDKSWNWLVLGSGLLIITTGLALCYLMMGVRGSGDDSWENSQAGRQD